MLPNNVPFYGYITLAFAFISWCTLQLFLLFGYLNNIPMKIQVFYEYIFSFLFLRIIGLHVNFKIFEELPIFNMAAIFYISTSNVWEFQILYINANIILPFWLQYLTGYKLVSHCGLIYIFLMINDTEHLLMWLLAIHISSS